MLLMSCNQHQDIIEAEADLRWTGPLAADGCGFFLDIDGQEYKPANEEVIPETLQNEFTQRVKLRYEVLQEPVPYSCGMLPTHYQSTIKILEISLLE